LEILLLRCGPKAIFKAHTERGVNGKEQIMALNVWLFTKKKIATDDDCDSSAVSPVCDSITHAPTITSIIRPARYENKRTLERNSKQTPAHSIKIAFASQRKTLH
jgi:hypothetical protein